MNRNQMISYLREVTTYNIKTLQNKTDSQLLNMVTRIRNCMETYPEEIYNYLKEHVTMGPNYELRDLKQMKYNELSAIRKSLGIRKSRKKVTSTVDAPANVLTKAKEAIQAKTEKELIDEIEDYVFLTEDEIKLMYPGEELSDKELERLGYKRYEPQDRVIIDNTSTSTEEIDDDFDRNLAIETILQLTEKYSIETLSKLDDEYLKYMMNNLSFEETKRKSR